MNKRRSRNDKTGIGFSTGILFPLLVFVVIYYVKYPDVQFIEYVENLWQIDQLLKILSLCVFPNLLLFLLYIRKKRDLAARGVVAATILYALLVLFSKVF